MTEARCAWCRKKAEWFSRGWGGYGRALCDEHKKANEASKFPMTDWQPIKKIANVALQGSEK